MSPLVSSTVYRLQTPFGLVPLKVARVVALNGVGAGAGKVSAPSLTLVGLNAPVPTAPEFGIVPAAASSKVRVPLTGKPPELATSDISTRFWPAGPTSNTSMSWAIGWDNPVRITLTSVTTPVIPLIVIGDG